MHYKNGREAKNGDKVVLISPYNKTPVAGILYDAVAGNDFCNGRIAITTANDPCPNLKECLHADDVLLATVPDSTVPAAPVTTLGNIDKLAEEPVADVVDPVSTLGPADATSV